MFTLLRDNCNNESVYSLIQPPQQIPAPGPPLYKSRFSCKVREEAYDARKGCFLTMGVPRVCQDPPTCYLKKQTRAPISIRRKVGLPKVEMVCDPCQTGGGGDNEENTADCTPPPATEECSMLAECGSGDQAAPAPPCCQEEKCRIARICLCAGLKEKPPVPPPCAKFGVIPTCCKDYVRDNIRNAVRQVPRKPTMRFVDDRVGHTKNWCTSGMPRLYVCGENFGKIPCYLEDIKADLYAQAQKEKSLMKAQETTAQENCRHLDPVERDAITCGLKKNWEEVFADYQALPLLIDTPGKIHRKSELEKELKKLEQDIQVLERHDHLFVADTCRSFYLA